MSPERVEKIEAAIAALVARGEPVTNRAVYDIAGGSYRHLARYLKARRAGATGGSVAVSEEDEPDEPPPGAVEPARPAPDSPLGQAQQRVQACAVEDTRVGEAGQALRARGRELDAQLRVLRTHEVLGITLAQVRQARERRAILEAERRAAVQAVAAWQPRRLQQCTGLLQATQAYRHLVEQAQGCLARLRLCQRQAAAPGRSAFARVELAEALVQAQAALAEVVGNEAASLLAQDPSRSPRW